VSNLLEILGKGLEASLATVILPQCQSLTDAQADQIDSDLQAHPLQADAALRLAVHHAKNGATQRAEKLLDAILEHDPRNLQARLAWAALHCGAGNVDQAVNQLESAMPHHPNDARVLFALGYCRERQGQVDPALRLYQQAAAAQPYLPQPRQRIAAIELCRRQYPGVIDQYRCLQKEHPESVSVYLMLGQLYFQTDQNEDAQAAFERALTIEPDNFEMHDDNVESLVQLGKIDQAIQQLQDIIQQQGDFPDSYVRLADLYSQLADDNAALTNYQKALQLHPGYLEAAVKLGTQHMRMGQLFDAAINFSRAIEINDQLITAYVGLGIAQQRLGKTELATDTINLARALQPNTDLLFAELARLQVRFTISQKTHQDVLSLVGATTKPQEDLDHLVNVQMARHRQVLTDQPNRADIHYLYGLLLRGRGDTEQAAKHFRHTLEINPSYLKAHIKLGLTLLDQQQHDAALTALQEAFILKAEFIDLHYKLALMACDPIEFAMAVEQCQASLPSQVEKTEIQANLSLALQNMALLDRAAANWRTICELEPHSKLALHAQRATMTIKPTR